MNHSGADAADARPGIFFVGPIRSADHAKASDVPRGRTVLCVLWEAYQSAEEVRCGVWDFAVEIEELQRRGCTHSELRWLVSKGLVEHACEVESRDGRTRSFLRRSGLSFGEKTCFILTESGIAVVRRLAEEGSGTNGRVVSEPNACDCGRTQTVQPKWDRDRQELRLGREIVKQFKVPAVNQERILAAFEEEQWPVRIDDPLPPHPCQDSKRRLHDTINSLNRNQKLRLIRFMGDGSGEGIRWDSIPPNGNGQTDGYR
ncbi:MAG TPA: hypothetical protein VMY42_21995 [Thermoguttaceae bacterium]|nr:hypothetical protein [Thermoguttaceae bacterium]